MLRHDLADHLKALGPAPFLFVGAGVPRRYAGSPSWSGLLQHFAGEVDRDYDFLSATANGRQPQIATLIAEALHSEWWQSDEYERSRKRFAGVKLGTTESALKAEVAIFVEEATRVRKHSDVLDEELNLLSQIVVDGVITTNYDPFLESLFPDYKVYIGEEGLLFADVQGVGEIYKIHGDVSTPDSIVLTTADYDHFNSRKPYLAAKLLTIFVERPIVFLGYSLSDENILEILRSIAAALTREHIGQLQNRLIFVEWDEGAPDDPVLTGTAIPVEGGFSIPVQHLRVRDFVEVFHALSDLERRFPARYLRHLKEHVYELVRDQKPNGKLYVADFDPDVDLSDVEIVLGVGAIQKIVESYRGRTRIDLLDDVVAEGDLVSRRVLDEVLPGIPPSYSAPIYKYLRLGGYLTPDGQLSGADDVNEKVIDRYNRGTDPFQPPRGYQARADLAVSDLESFTQLVESYDPGDVVMYVARLPEEKQEPAALREYLMAHRRDLHVEGHSLDRTQWAKAVLLYDWLAYRRI
jgi:hypothetical protein